MEPGNEWFATGSSDRTIKLWELASGRLKLTLTGHISAVRALTVSHRQPYLFSAGEDKQVKCWDLEYNKVVRHYHGHLSGVYCMSLHPTIDILLTGGRDATARVWDMRTKACIHTLGGHTNTVADILTQAPNPQCSCLVHCTAGDNGSLHFWDWKTGYNFQKHQTTVQPGSLDSEAGIFKCLFDVSGCRLLTAEADKTIKIYKEDDTAVLCSDGPTQDILGMQSVSLFVCSAPHPQIAENVALTLNSLALILKRTLLSHSPTGANVGDIYEHAGKDRIGLPSQTLVLSKGTQQLVPRRALQTVRPEWHPPWKLMRVLSGHLGWVRCIAMEPGNEWFATGSSDRTIKLWELASGRLKLTLTGHISAVRALTVSHRQPYLFSAGEDKQVKCWDLEYNKVRH
ncbi:Pleiotropic regulator 1 [Geodia barretti]|uniref:Pleiotropic regulator 1 n=1 Tax=Geodia barretti TaxID=519541 RepID=A0AA35QYL5_GEOBA|nr:Pleiotropic regulator 1 [Geodia barretti]